MNDIEIRLRKLAERMEQIKPEDLVGKEDLLNQLDDKTQELESLYNKDKE